MGKALDVTIAGAFHLACVTGQPGAAAGSEADITRFRVSPMRRSDGAVVERVA
jgi:hypothetical protein